MDRGDIIAVVFGAVVVLAAVICVFYAKMRKSNGQDIAPSIAASGPVDHAQPLPRFTTVTIEQIHRKYDDLAETDPILAGKLKYAELLQHHGE